MSTAQEPMTQERVQAYLDNLQGAIISAGADLTPEQQAVQDFVHKQHGQWYAAWKRREAELDDPRRINGRYAALFRHHLADRDLRCADLDGAYLEGANLEGANLLFADLPDAYLGGANLRNANLEGANLEGAYFNDANFSIAQMQPGAFGRVGQGDPPKPEQLEGARIWYHDPRTGQDYLLKAEIGYITPSKEANEARDEDEEWWMIVPVAVEGDALAFRLSSLRTEHSDCDYPTLSLREAQKRWEWDQDSARGEYRAGNKPTGRRVVVTTGDNRATDLPAPGQV